MQRFALAAFGALSLGALLVFSGCAADLENPKRFDDGVAAGGTGATAAGGTSATSGGTSATAGGAPAAIVYTAPPQCVADFFGANTCLICHGDTPISQGLISLSPGFEKHTIGVVAPHAGVASSMTAACGQGSANGAKFIDQQNAAASWLLIKIQNTQGQCGSLMPQGGTAIANTDAGYQCLVTYLNSVATANGGVASAK